MQVKVLAVLCDSQYSNTPQVPVLQHLGVEVVLLSEEMVEHEKLSPQAAAHECVRKSQCVSVWPRGAQGEASPFSSVCGTNSQQRAPELRSRSAARPQQRGQGVGSAHPDQQEIRLHQVISRHI